MKAIFSAADIIQVTHIKNILEANEIECTMKNSFLTGAAGELPMFETWPQLFLVDMRQYDAALDIIRKDAEPAKTGESWVCSNCTEVVEGQFDQCWKCGREKRFEVKG